MLTGLGACGLAKLVAQGLLACSLLRDHQAMSRHFPPPWLAAICAGCDVSAPTGASRLHKRRPCPEFYSNQTARSVR